MRFLKSGRQTTFDEGLNIIIKVIAVVAVAYHLIAMSCMLTPISPSSS